MWDAILEALIDSLKILPFLLLVYILIEVFEHTVSSKMQTKFLRGNFAPLVGASVGIIPQCGFSVVATKLYTTKSIALGTLLATYISTSDEAFAVLISDFSALPKLIPLLIIKFIFALMVGYSVNFFVRKKELTSQTDEHLSAHGCHNHVVGFDNDCGHCNDHTDEHPSHLAVNLKRYLVHPLLHSLTTFAFILAVNIVLNLIIFFIGEDSLFAFMNEIIFLQPFLAGLIGLIPNCAASVVIAEMYALNALSLGGAVAGLSVSAGIALALLIKENKPLKNSLLIIALLYGLSVSCGLIVCVFETIL